MMKRRSVRHFKDTVIPEHLINQLLDAANNAPSGGNIQPLSIITIQDRERKSKLSQLLGGQLWVEHAPLTMIFCLDFFRLKKWASMSDTKFLGEKSLSHFLIAYADVICASQNVVILAESLGLGSVYIGVVQSVIDQVRSFLSIPELVLPLMVLCLGYPASIPKNIPKLKRNVIVHEETYNVMSDQEIIEAYNLKYGKFDEDPEKYLEKAYKEVLEAGKYQNKTWLQLTKKRMIKFGIKNHAQFLFNLRYPSEAMVKNNVKQKQSFKKAGFDLF